MRVALISDLHGNALALRRGGSRVAALLVLSMALVGTACKKTARRPAGGATAGGRADGAVPVLVVAPDAALAGPLPGKLDQLQGGCIGFTPGGDGVLLVLEGSDRTAGGEVSRELAFHMLNGAAPPFEAQSWIYTEAAGPTSKTEAEAEYAGQVEALNQQINQLGLLRCNEHLDGVASPGGKQVRVDVEDKKVVMTVNGNQQLVRELFVGDSDGQDHESLDTVYFSPQSPLLLILIRNEDTGLSETRPLVLSTR